MGADKGETQYNCLMCLSCCRYENDAKKTSLNKVQEDDHGANENKQAAVNNL